MLPKHPFTWLSPTGHKALFIIGLILTVGTMISLQLIDRELRTPAAPNGIVSFELAGTLPAATAILDSWDPVAQIWAGLSLGLDYLFMLLYASTIALGCLLVARGRAAALRRSAHLLAWGQVAAALLDAVENFALIRLLLGDLAPIWPALARAAALPKFTLVAAGLLFFSGVLLSGLVGGRRRFWR